VLPRKATVFSLGALVALLLVLAAPASAITIASVVNTNTDEASTTHNSHECKTALGNCSLRAAMELVDEEEDVTNVISFDPTVFNGEEQDAIFVNTPLPAIEYPTTIEAGTECTTAGVEGAPCAGVIGLPTDPVFVVDADDTTIKGLSVAAGSVNIEVNESTGFEAIGDWIGIEMSGSNALPASTVGILLGHGSDEATIGGSGAGERNVIAFNEVGLDIFGASHTTVQGNWFGVTGNGVSPGRQDTDIEITNYKHSTDPEVEAEGNEIGGPLDTAAEESPECDGACNVISSAVDHGIDLSGDGAEAPPARGPTKILANYLGLDATGEQAVLADDQFPSFEGNKGVGIEAGAAGQLAVGGAAGSESNYFVGGLVGISFEGGDEFEAKGNFFGQSQSGEPIAAMQGYAIAAVAAAGTEGPVIAGNQIKMGESGTAILESGGGSQITGNKISGGGAGIFSPGNTAGTGSLIEDNLIEDVEGIGIFVSNAENKILGNEVLRARDTGIEVSSGSTADDGNVIGGDPPEAENVVSDGGGFAIVIAGDEGTRNEIRANHGSGNEGELGFIVLRDVPNEEPNGVEEPTIEAAGKTEASGKAEPYAIVRVFYKASAEPGELGGYLGKAEADGSGDWKVAYNAPVPAETRITATQTLDGGTSMLADPVKTSLDPPPPPVCPGASGCETTPPPSSSGSSPSSSTPAAPQPAPDTIKPKVTIKAAPKAKSTSTTARFKFVSNEPGSSFQCKLDKKPFKPCRSPKTYKKLKPGKHVFKVEATDPAGNVSAVVIRKFTVAGP
jgi:hypothetical protein